MLPLQKSELFGNWATLLLPINKDETIDFLRLEEEIDVLLSMKVNGIYSNGTAGEFYNQTEAEFYKIQEMLAQKCNAVNLPFQIGCSHVSPIMSLERVTQAVTFRPGAIQVILPDWYAPNMKEIIDFLDKIARISDPIGIVIYNPPHAKKILTPNEYAQILATGIPVIGCKVAGGNEQWYTDMKQEVHDLSLFVPGHTLATGIKLGAHGSYSNVACLNPQAAQNWYQMMIDDMAGALALESRIQQFIQRDILPLITDGGYSSQAIDKLLAAVGGWAAIGSRLRWPYQWIDELTVLNIRKKCRALLPEFFD